MNVFFACQRSVSFSVVEAACGFPGSPRNGSLLAADALQFAHEETVTYRCQEGFVLFGNDQRTCGANGTWSDGVPECRE